MRRVKFKSLDAGPKGVRHPGTTHPLSDDEAAELVKGGFAEYVDLPPAKKESAMLPPPTANAMQPPPGPSGQPRPQVPAGNQSQARPGQSSQQRRR